MSATASLYPTTVASTAGTTWASTTNATGSTAATFATFTNTTSGGVGTAQLSGYGAQAATNGGVQPATISSVTVTVASFVGTIARTASITVQLYSGASTAIGSPTTLTISATSTNVQTVILTGANCPTWAQMSDLRAQVVFTRAAVTTANVFSLDYVGAIVNYFAVGAVTRLSAPSTSTGVPTSVAVTIPGGGVAAGALVAVSLLAWGYNAGTVTAIADSRTNTWVNHVTKEDSATGLVDHWSSVITTPLLSGDAITVSITGMSAALNDYAVAADIYTGITGLTNVGAEAAIIITGTSTTPSVSLTPAGGAPLSLIHASVGTETTAPTITEDTDATGGDTWSTLGPVVSTTSGRIVQQGGACKFPTSPATAQTYNPTLSASELWAAYIVRYPIVTAAAGLPPARAVRVNQAVKRAATY